MKTKILEYRSKSMNLITQARAVLDAASAETRSLTAEEQVKYDKMFNDAAELRKTADNLEKQIKVEQELRESTGIASGKEVPEAAAGEKKEAEQRAAFSKFLRTGVATPELRLLQADAPQAGGYLIPMGMSAQIIKGLDATVVMRKLATVQSIKGSDSLGINSLDNDPADPIWTPEVGTGNEDNSTSFGQREMKPHPLAKRIKVSNKLLRLVPDIEALIVSRLVYKFSVTEEYNFLNGDGVNKPLGVFVTSDKGIPASRDIVSDNSATAPTVDGLMDVKYGVKEGYARRASWLFHQDACRILSKLKDGEGRYIWQPSILMGQPDVLLGRPVIMSEFGPKVFSAGMYFGIFGDFSYYNIVDNLDMNIQRLVELYAESNKTGFIGRKETDGAPVLGEAFARVKLGA